MRKIFKRIKNDFIYFAIKFFLSVVRFLPLMMTETILDVFAKIAARLPTRENKIALKNLSMFYSKDESKKIRIKMYLNWSRSIAELISVIIKGVDIREFVSITEDAKRVLDEALNEGKGVVFFTAHIGNWELMAMCLSAHGYNVNTIAKESYDSRLTRLIREIREKNGVRCIFRGEEGIINKIRQIISSNSIMGFLIDQNTKVPSIKVQFLGAEAPTPLLPAKILKETNAALVVGFNHRIDGRIRVEIKRVIYSNNESEREILERVNRILSEEITKFPHEWIWIHNRWDMTC
ncbi:MAG: lysophospholipid acyltransferase family protein [Deltaproteobacteria bacterium]|nr:lysophospholipid acyltransferase family protein [Deltaproteobacteria bacterium]